MHIEYLFEFDIKEERLRNVGRSDENFKNRDIYIWEDCRIIGITGSKDRGMRRVFCYSQEHGFEDLEIIQAWQPMLALLMNHCVLKQGQVVIS